MVEIKVGDFVVERGRYSRTVYEVTKVTDKCFWYPSWDRKKDIRRDRSEIVFAGGEAVARKLCEQLTSSRAQQSEDERAAFTRRVKRDDEFIAAASKQT